MKNKLLFFGTLVGVLNIGTALSQRGNSVPTQAHLSEQVSFSAKSTDLDRSGSRAVTCIDTIRYVQAKELYLGTAVPPSNGNYYILGVWEADNEAISQTYLLSGASISITGVEFVAKVDNVNGTPTATVAIEVYSVDGTNAPTTLLGSQTITLSNTAYAFQYVNFASAITVNSNYAIVMRPTSADAVVDAYVNDLTPSQSYDEGLSRFTSTYSGYGSGGNWVDITTAAIFNSAADGEAVLNPIVSYTLSSDFSATPLTACEGSAVAFTNESTPETVLSNRMLSFWNFAEYFGLAAADSTSYWDMGDGTIVVGGDHSHTYNTAGTYTVDLVVIGGFMNTCGELSSETITVVAPDDASFSYGASTVCAGGPNVTTSSVATAGGTFSASPAGLTIDPSTGEIDLSSSSNGTYTITYDLTGTCPSSSTQSITVTSAPDASFTYAAIEYCTNGSNPSPVFTTGSAGTFSSTTGLSIGTNGVINLAASTPGTYTVTNEISAAGCPVTTETFDVTIEAAPTVSAGSNVAICAGESTTITASGADSYSWDNGLGAGASHPVSPTNTTSYIVTGTATNGCTNTGTVTVSVNQLPNVSAGSNAAVCLGSSVTITGSGASTYDWDNGLGAGASHSVSPTTATTYTVTGTDANGCENTASVTITVNPVPTASMGTLNTICSYYAPITLNQGSPAGGTYSGPGVTGTTFNPATAGVGTHTITYSVTQSGCTGTATATIEVSACAGIESSSAAELLSVFPNPASSELNVVFENTSSTDATIVLTTTDGKIVYQSTAKAMSVFNEKINVTEFANGVYFIKIGSDKTAVVQKVVLN